MAARVTPVTEKPMKNKDYFTDKVAHADQVKKESDARWYKDHPHRTPGYNPTQTWKTFSGQRHASAAFAEGYEKITWGTR